MKRFMSIIAVILVLAVPALALSDAEYLRMKKSSADFAAADKFLSDAYNNVKNVMSRSEFASVKEEQREWIKSGRDEAARAFMNEGYSKIEAYTKATEERAEELYHIFQMYMK
ncbi:MAG: DUF1311 domain-containing protein [Synergistaceae bacterium]|nr:DUF1311 domain-containing protein [Synergistaceae bacterium]